MVKVTVIQDGVVVFEKVVSKDDIKIEEITDEEYSDLEQDLGIEQ